MKTLVISICIGPEWDKIGLVSLPTHAAYAVRTRSDFMVIRERRFPAWHVHFEKLLIVYLLKEYDRVFYADCDVIISPHAPNVFDVVPEAYFGAFDENYHHPHQDILERAAQFYGVTLPEKPPYFNAGVFVISRHHREMLKIPTDILESPTPEQDFLNVRRIQCGHPLFDLGPTWNSYSHAWSEEELGKANLIHYAAWRPGTELLIDRMRTDFSRWMCQAGKSSSLGV